MVRRLKVEFLLEQTGAVSSRLQSNGTVWLLSALRSKGTCYQDDNENPRTEKEGTEQCSQWPHWYFSLKSNLKWALTISLFVFDILLWVKCGFMRFTKLLLFFTFHCVPSSCETRRAVSLKFCKTHPLHFLTKHQDVTITSVSVSRFGLFGGGCVGRQRRTAWTSLHGSFLVICIRVM